MMDAGLTGVDAPYEVPVDPELRLTTVGRTAQECAADVLATIKQHGVGGGR